MSNTREKALTCKVCKFINNRPPTALKLQELLEAALSKYKKASQRFFTERDGEKRFLNARTMYEEVTCGTFYTFTPNQIPLMLQMDEDAEVLQLKRDLPLTSGQEVIEGALYFAISGNNIVIAQSKATRGKQLEDYLNWFLRQASLLASNDGIVLTDHIKEEYYEHIRSVKRLKLSAPIRFTKAETQDTQATNVRLKPSGAALEAIQALLKHALVLPVKMDSEEIFETSNVEVDLFVTLKGTKKGDYQEGITALAEQLRHVEEEMEYTTCAS